MKSRYDPETDALYVLRRDNQDEATCCLIEECSRRSGRLPHAYVPEIETAGV